ncbi:hypothetical protein, partial [Actinophytocola sp.]|uniref:hypothetical protein n=1 Tax=Actinophytocola sp. TaxID=1872138 RepID=UPI003899C455
MAPNNKHHYDTNRYAGDQAADTRRVMNHMPSEDRVPTGQIQQSINAEQAADLANGDVRFGDDRVIPDPPNWDTHTSSKLYSFATEKNSPYTADDLGRAFNDGGNSLADAANGLLDAVSRLDDAWTGVAADTAKGALKPLAQAAGTAGTTAQLMGVRMSQQSVAASEVQKLPPPKEFDQQQSLNAMIAGGPAAMQQDLKAQKDAADAVKREQVSYLTTYTSALSAVDAQTPSFVPPQDTISGGGGNGTNITADRIHTPTTRTPTLGTTSTGTTSGTHTGTTGSSGNPVLTGGSGNTGQSGHTPPPGASTGSAAFTPPSATNPTPGTFGPTGTPGGPGSGAPGGGQGGFGPGFGGGFGG